MRLKMTLAAFVLLSIGAFAQAPMPAGAIVPQGAEIKVRTDTTIPAKPPANRTYAAKVSQDVVGASGQVVIPRGARATRGRTH